ncbi:MAG: chloride channel protein [Eubacteriales bacterium]|nr:chloride channel protein [Eubacteriales bacterium]
MKIKNNYEAVINLPSNKFSIMLKSILVGLLTGILISAYRFVLVYAGEISLKLYSWLGNHIEASPIALLVLVAGGLLIGFLVSRYNMISGSGIPQVKGIMMGYFNNNWLSTLLAKFFGGALCILAGLSLGREGPSIQLGSCIAQGVGNKLASTRTEKKILIASGAGAGLAAAFNAPLAGAMFALEEIFRYFSPVILLSTLVSAIAADFVSKIVFGMNPVFQFGELNVIPLESYWIFFILGVILGVFGAFHNYILLSIQKLYKRINIIVRPVIPFLMAGVLGLYFPLVTGSGHPIIDELGVSASISFLFTLLIIKFLFSMISFGSGAPGGIFFPLLMTGAIIGGIFGHVTVDFIGYEVGYINNFIILAMAGFFTAIVRAPITGVILLVEMTGSFSHLLPLTVVSVTSYVIADLMKSAPIYESLLENLIKGRKAEKARQDDGKKITLEMIVHHGSQIENKQIKEIDFPASCLLIAVRRRGKDIIPRGNTRILAEDYLVILTDLAEEAKTRKYIAELIGKKGNGNCTDRGKST